MFDVLFRLIGYEKIKSAQATIEVQTALDPWDPKRFKISHKRRFEKNMEKLINVVKAVNFKSFKDYNINVCGHSFTFNSDLWVDYEIFVYDAWLVRTKLGSISEYNALRLADDEQENWWRLANAVEEAIEEVKRRDRETQAKEMMNAMTR